MLNASRTNNRKPSKARREYNYEEHRKRYLPGQLATARKKVQMLVNEAKTLGLEYLLESHEQ